MNPLTEKQRTEAKRLLKAGKSSKEVAKSVGAKTMQIAGVAANMNRSKSNRPIDKKLTNKLAVSIANTGFSASLIINQIKNLRTSNPKAYNDVLKGVKSLKA